MALNLDRRISVRLFLGYDIWCQYGVHLLERFRRFAHLSFPDFLEELTGIVGAWHIYAHVRACFGRFSGLYVWGLGMVEFEIVETVWSLLNLVTDSCRNMSRANREETINFHMNDMNLKKIRNLGESGSLYKQIRMRQPDAAAGLAPKLVPPRHRVAAAGLLAPAPHDLSQCLPRSPSTRSGPPFAPHASSSWRPWTRYAQPPAGNCGRISSVSCTGSAPST